MKTSHISPILLLAISFATLTAFAADPLEVNASDIIGKVYAVADPAYGRDNCRETADEQFALLPACEEGAEWLTSAEGFRLSYEGMQPEVEAMAEYDNGMVSSYGYIFYFPYASAQRETANGQQCEFCTALLQELKDLGIDLGADPMTANLFDVRGIFHGSHIHLTLSENVANETLTSDLRSEEIPADREGEFTLLISIVPAQTFSYTAGL